MKFKIGTPKPIPAALTKILRWNAVKKFIRSPLTVRSLAFRNAFPRVVPNIVMITGSNIIQTIRLTLKMVTPDKFKMKFGIKRDTRVIRNNEHKERSRNLAKIRTKGLPFG